MAVKKTIDIDINTNAEQAAGEINDLNKSLKDSKKAYDKVLTSGDSYEKQLEDINKIVKTVPLNVRDMNKQIQAYQSIALSAGRETPIGQKALKQAADLKDKYIDIQNETKRLADDHKHLRGAMEVGTTVIAGYSAVQGAMALSGVESEALRETMVKLQGAQTLLAGVQQISVVLEKESAAMITLKAAKTKIATAATAAYATVTGTTTGALKLFRLALASTGIGLIVVGLGLLVANFDKVLGAMKPVIQAFKDFGDWIGLTNFAEEERNKARDKRFDAEKKRHKQTMDNAAKEIEAIKKLVSAEKKRQGEIEATYALQLRQAKGNSKEIEKINEELTQSKKVSLDEEERLFRESKLAQIKQEEAGVKVFETIVAKNQAKGRSDHAKELAEITKRSEKISKLKAQFLDNDYIEIESFNVRRGNLDIDYDEGVDARRKASNDRYRQHLSERLSIARKIEGLENSLLEDGIEKELEINRDKFRILREDAKGNAQEKIDLRALYDRQEKQAEEKIIADNQARRVDAFEKEKSDKQELIDFVAEQNAAEVEANKAKNLKKIEDDKAASKKIIEEAQAVADAKLAIQNAQISNVEAGISLLKDAAGENNKLQALAIAAESAVGIAKTIIATQAANAAAVAQGTALAIPSAGASVAAAAALVTQNNISAGISIAASIAAAAKGISALGGGATAPSGDAPSGGGGGESSAPNFNIVGNSGINQLASLQQQPVQAFVVSGEVTTSQALDRNRVENATL